MSLNWRVYGADTVAYRLDKAELPGWIRKKVVVAPGEGAVVIRDGQAEELLHAGSSNVHGLLDGAAAKLLGWLSGSAEVQVIFLDLGPIRVRTYLGESRVHEQAAETTTSPDGWVHHARATNVTIQAVTADRQVISAECVTVLRVDLANAARVATLLKGTRGLSRWDLAAYVRDGAMARALIPQLAAASAADLRGDAGLTSRIASWVRAEVGASLQSVGFIVDDVIINWGLTDAERHEVAQRRAALEDEARQFAHRRCLAEIQRGLEVDRARIENLHELKLAEAQHDEGLKDLCLAGEFRRAAVTDGRRVDVAKVDAEVRSIQLEAQRKEGELRLEQRRADELTELDLDDRRFRQAQQQRLAQVDAEDKELRGMVALQIEMATAKHERRVAERRIEIDAEFRRTRAELDARLDERRMRLEEDRARMDQVRTILNTGLAQGVVTGEVLNTFLTESTRQSFGTAADPNAQAMFAAEAAKHQLQTFRDAEDRERKQQQEMTRLSAELMQASKQPSPTTTIVGSGGMPVPFGAPVPPAAEAGARPPSAADLRSRLGKLKELFAEGLIDEAEFKQRKAAILDGV